METTSGNKPLIIKTLYLYVVSLVALFMVIFSVADLINIALLTFVFTKADSYGYYPQPACETASASSTPEVTKEKQPYCVNEERQKNLEQDNRSAQRQRDLVRDISFIVVGVPLFLYHWGVIRKKEI